MSPTTQLQKPLGVVFGLLSVLKVRAMRVRLRLIGQSGVRATGRWWRLAVGVECQKTSQRRAATMAQQRDSSINKQRAVVGITWG